MHPSCHEDTQQLQLGGQELSGGCGFMLCTDKSPPSPQVKVDAKNRQELLRYLAKKKRLSTGQQKPTETEVSEQGYTEVNKGIQRCTEVNKGIQRCSEVNRSIGIVHTAYSSMDL